MTPARSDAGLRRQKIELISRVQSRAGGVAVLHAELPLSDFQRAEEAALEQFRRNTRWPGFRRGGVPLDKVRQRFGAQAREEGLRQLLQDRTPDVLARHAIEAVGLPLVDEVALEETRVRFRISVECAPDLTSVEWKGLRLTDPGVRVEREAVESLLEDQRRASADFQPAPVVVPGADQVVTVEARGRTPAAQAALAGQGPWDIDLGTTRADPAVRKALAGAGVGDAREVAVAIPGSDGEGKNKSHAVALTVRAIRQRVRPTMDNAWAKRLGFADVAALRAAARAALDRAAEERRRRSLEKQMSDRLLETHPVELPPTLVEEECRRLWAALRGPSAPWSAAASADAAAVRAEAARNLTLTFLLSRIATEEGLRVTPADAAEAFEREVAALPSEWRERARIPFEKRREEIGAALLTERVFDAVLAQAQWTNSDGAPA